ncbi:Fcf1-domain-containing protein, partial [Backusella circina FSU 941]
MVAKADRSIRKTVHSYQIGFGFKPPFRILLDGDFCHSGLQKKIYIKDELPNLMHGTTKPLVTECTLQDLKAKGPDFTSAYILAKKFEVCRCKHKEPISSYECIRSLIGEENPKHYCVATQNPKLKDRMRKIPGVPILYVKQNTLGLEPMTTKSKQAMHQHEQEKTQPLDKETARLKRALVGDDKQREDVEDKPKFKKRKVKGVNPLAMKKKKK